MSHEIRCARCDRLPFLEQTMAGRKARCRKCKTPLLVADDSKTIYRVAELKFALANMRLLALPVGLAAVLAAAILVKALSGSGSAPGEMRPVAAETVAANRSAARAEYSSGNLSGVAPAQQVQDLPKPAPAPPRKPRAQPSWPVPAPASRKPALDEDTGAQAKPNNPAAVMAVCKSAAELGTLSEEELLVQLKKVVRLEVDPALQQQIVARQSSKLRSLYLHDLKDCKTGLPFLEGNDCVWPIEPAQVLVERSLVIRRGVDEFSRALRPDDDLARRQGHSARLVACVNLDDSVEFVGAWREKTTVISLQQILMAGDSTLRGVLVECLARIRGKTATAALAQRALFDQNADNRDAATAALKNRPPQDYVSVLLAGLKYPWPTVSQNAARALAALQQKDVVDDLVQLLDQPDPDLPYREAGLYKVREMVRLNHLRNCLLCHPPSFEGNEVRGLVPNPTQPLPDGSQGRVYYGGQTGPFVRADVTYLRQDFSVMQEVGNPGPWPALQRFDFFVRVRELTRAEAIERGAKRGPEASQYKKAIVFALRELTGLDAAPTAAAWRRRLLVAG